MKRSSQTVNDHSWCKNRTLKSNSLFLKLVFIVLWDENLQQEIFDVGG